jgi:hypothetical protein
VLTDLFQRQRDDTGRELLMTGVRRRILGMGVVAVVAAGGLVGSGTSVLADGASVADGMQTQSDIDAAQGSPGNSSDQGGWADMAGGLAARPYVTAMSVINGGTTTSVLTADAPVTVEVAPGHLGAVVAPVNLCPAGQSEQAGQCYSRPNRVALTVVYGADGGGNGWDFAAPRAETITPAVTEDTVIDMTIALNTLGKSLRWSWLNGHLIDWRTENLGQDNATVRVRFRPATVPSVDWSTAPPNNGCTATPIFNCDIVQAQGEKLAATLLFSLDDTLDPALTGAVFATRNAIAGFLQPGGNAAAPLLDIQAASTHRTSLGALQKGTIEAFLPAGALLNLYGVLPSDAASFFSTTRTGSIGANDPPTYAPWAASSTRSEGVLVTVNNVTFSAPIYKVKSKLPPTATSGKTVNKTTTVRASIAACTKKAPCLATIYKLNKAEVSRQVGARTAVLSNRAVTTTAVALSVASTVLKKSDRYLLVVRNTKNKRPIASSLGGVT